MKKCSVILAAVILAAMVFSLAASPVCAYHKLTIRRNISLGTLKSMDKRSSQKKTLRSGSVDIYRFKLTKTMKIEVVADVKSYLIKGDPPGGSVNKDALEQRAIGEVYASNSSGYGSTSKKNCKPGSYYVAAVNTGDNGRAYFVDVMGIDLAKKGSKRSKSEKDSAIKGKSKRAERRQPGPPQLTLQLNPPRIDVPAGQIVGFGIRVRNIGESRAGDIRVTVSPFGEIDLKTNTLGPGGYMNRTIVLPPAAPGMNGYEVKLTCSQGGTERATMLVNGLGGLPSQAELHEAGPPPESIPPDQIHRLMPDMILDAASEEVEDRRDWGMFTRRYGTTLEQNSILVTINKNYNINEEINKASYERWLRGNSDKLEGVEIKRYDGYPVPIGTNEPGHWIVGAFWFSWFECQVQCTGNYAYMKYFDNVVRAILSNLGYAAPPSPYLPQQEDEEEGGTGDNPAKLEMKKVKPDEIKLTEGRNVMFTVTVANSAWQGRVARDITVTITDSDGREIGRGLIDRINNHDNKIIEVNAFVDINEVLASRKLTVKASSPTAAAETWENAKEVRVEGIRPADVTMTVSPDELTIDLEMAEPEFMLNLKNRGDQRAEDLYLRARLEETDIVSDVESLSTVEGTEEEDASRDLKRVLSDLADRYLKAMKDIPESGSVLVELMDGKDGPVIDTARIFFRIGATLSSRLSLQVAKLDKKIDLYESWEPDWAMDDIDDYEYSREGRTMRFGSPFRIYLKQEGVMNTEDVALELLNPDGSLVASWEFPVLHSGFIKHECDIENEAYEKLPEDVNKFIQLARCGPGRNEFTLVLRQHGDVIEQKKLVLEIPTSELRLGLAATSLAFDRSTGAVLGPVEVEVPPLGEEVRYYESFYLGSPLDIRMDMYGLYPMDNVSVAFVHQGKSVLKLSFPRVALTVEAETPAIDERFPDGAEFLSALACKEGKNTFTVELRAGGKVIQDEKVFITVKGVDTAKTVICADQTFRYHPEKLKTYARKGEKVEVGRWEKKSFVGEETYRKPVSYEGVPYIPIAYVSGSEVTGYLWINQHGTIVRSEAVNRALFTYMNVLGFNPDNRLQKGIAEFKESAARATEEIESYSHYKETAATLKLASTAMGLYLGLSSGGGLLDFGLSGGLAAADAHLFITKMKKLEEESNDLSALDGYSWTLAKASDLSTLASIADCIESARAVGQAKAALDASKSARIIADSRAMLMSTKQKLIAGLTSFGWTVFDSAEKTGQIAEQAAVMAIQFARLKYQDLLLVKILEEGLDRDIRAAKEIENIKYLGYLKASRNDVRQQVLSEMLSAYRERKKSISGKIGRLVLYAQGRSVDEGKAEQAINDLATFIEWDFDDYATAKLRSEVMTALAAQRTSFSGTTTSVEEEEVPGD